MGQRLFNVFFDLDIRNLVARIHQQNFSIRIFQSGLVGLDQPAPECLVSASLAINTDANIHFLIRKQLLGGGGQGHLQRTKDNFLAHVFLARQRIYQQQHFAAHDTFLLKSTFNFKRAFSTSAHVNFNNERPVGVSISSPSCSP